jgi:hypothetical protein
MMMPTRQELLDKHTHKHEGLDVGQRVYYTLRPEHSEDNELVQHRTAQLVALITQKLVETEKLTEDELDEMLIRLVTS